ncbi:hypothetical protein [Mariniflexile sp. HMF6888]|uniref:hypothetical protein n=1 Tax=Mariniflexile sp. HMF6888 TaxID=3373086 RepID=UPI0037A24ABF
MDLTHIHLILTHFPIVGTIIGIGILAYGQFAKNDDVKKVALVTFVLMAILTIPVFLTGEPAEESVEHLTGVSENIIEEHEELAKKAIWLMGLLGVFSLISFYAIIKKTTFAKMMTLITLVISLTTFGIFAKVGNLGGQIRHTEIGVNSNNVQEENNSEMANPYNEDDDD